jgi:cytochrome c556
MLKLLPTTVILIAALGVATAAPTPMAKTVKEIMGKINKGSNAMVIMLKRELQKDNPNWTEIQSQTKEYAALAAELKDAKPPKGDAASWAKLSQEFADTSKAMNDAAQKKDKANALAANNKLTNSCVACHKGHRD